jgi:hypothetical protein
MRYEISLNDSFTILKLIYNNSFLIFNRLGRILFMKMIMILLKYLVYHKIQIQKIILLFLKMDIVKNVVINIQI